ncbi:hypothetical protein A7D21_17710 [Pseudomonas sp. AP19]|uniref:hypothetical protein n=1 Tax=Pseudomonas TaxID=286 RepID=UPI00084AFB27|nr:hypothetical protein [Pseudomonas sp. AP19]OEC72673.1 hypothetical protein A7D21_17710 [Pseudomonas sp. AP19]
MEFSDEFLSKINDEPLAVALEVCKRIKQGVSVPNANSQGDLLLEAGLIIDSMVRNKLITTKSELPSIVAGRPRNPLDFFHYISGVNAELEAVVARSKAEQFQSDIEQRMNRLITGSFGYELTDGDLNEVQDLVNRLRELIVGSEELSADHRQRLLKRLEEVQRELHKKLSTLDHLYCLAIEASIVAGKVGKNAEPIVKVAKAILGISWRTHAHAEGLPSGVTPPLLGDDSVTHLIE